MIVTIEIYNIIIIITIIMNNNNNKVAVVVVWRYRAELCRSIMSCFGRDLKRNWRVKKGKNIIRQNKICS